MNFYFLIFCAALVSCVPYPTEPNPLPVAKEIFKDIIQDSTSIEQPVKLTLKDRVSRLKEKITEVADSTKQKSAAFASTTKEKITAAADATKEKSAAFASTTKEKITAAADSTKEKSAAFASAAKVKANNIKEYIRRLLAKLGEAASKAASATKEKSKELWQFLKNLKDRSVNSMSRSGVVRGNRAAGGEPQPISGDVIET